MQKPSANLKMIGLQQSLNVPFFTRVLEAVRREILAKRSGRVPVGVSPAKFDSLMSNPDMVGVVGFASSLDTKGKPMVNLSSADARPGPFVRVVNDDQAIGRMAARHLAESGAKFLLALEWFPQHMSDLRLEGFRREAEILELPFGVHRAEIMDSSDPLGYWEGLAMFFQKHLESPPPDTGLFAVNDDRMRHITPHLEEWGLRVPEDLMLVGADDLGRNPDAGCSHLSSVEPDAATLAARAVETLFAWIDSGTPPDTVPPVPPLGVVQRASTFRPDLIDPARHAMILIREGKHFADTAETLAATVGVSRVTLHRHFKREFGRAPHEVISAYRMKKARELLADKGCSVESVAVACGYTRASTFVNAFKHAHDGMTPGKWRLKMPGGKDARDT